MGKIKYLVPIYGTRFINPSPLVLEDSVVIRNIDLLGREYEIFKKHNLRAGYDVVLEIDYKFDDNNSIEPIPGISIRLLNIIDAALAVYGEGRVGIAAIIPADESKGYLSYSISQENPTYAEYLDKRIDENFVTYYKNFKKAYSMRPMAFDIFRRSQERFSNNDKTIDSCTVLESIFVPKGERSKKSFILNRLIIIGYKKEEVERIEKLIDYRNAIIHADRDKILSLYSGAVYTHFWFEETFKLIRKILYKYVENPWN